MIFTWNAKRKKVFLFTVLLTTLFVISGISITRSRGLVDRFLGNFKKEYKPTEPLVPPEVKVKPGFVAGKGLPIGKVQMALGKALVIHKGETSAYRMEKDFPIFSEDTLVTGERSRVNVKLNDRSVFSLAPVSKLVIDRSIYDPAKKKRSSLLSLLFGRARFIVAKLKGKSEYTVKTPTAVCGVRGTDFALAVTPSDEKIASVTKPFFSISLVNEAHALLPGALITTVLTGPGSTVGFSGLVGAAQTIGPFSLGAAAAGGAAIPGMAVGVAAATGALGAVGPGLASVSMPPGID